MTLNFLTALPDRIPALMRLRRAHRRNTLGVAAVIASAVIWPADAVIRVEGWIPKGWDVSEIWAGVTLNCLVGAYLARGVIQIIRLLQADQRANDERARQLELLSAENQARAQQLDALTWALASAFKVTGRPVPDCLLDKTAPSPLLQLVGKESRVKDASLGSAPLIVGREHVPDQRQEALLLRIS